MPPAAAAGEVRRDNAGPVGRGDSRRHGRIAHDAVGYASRLGQYPRQAQGNDDVRRHVGRPGGRRLGGGDLQGGGRVQGASADKVFLQINSADTITINRAALSGTLRKGGVDFPISDKHPGRRALAEMPATLKPVARRQLQDGDFSGSLMTSGSFTMVAGGGFG